MGIDSYWLFCYLPNIYLFVILWSLWCLVKLGLVVLQHCSGAWWPRQLNHRNITLLWGRVREIEHDWLEMVSLAFTWGSGTELPEKVWTLLYSGVTCRERRYTFRSVRGLLLFCFFNLKSGYSSGDHGSHGRFMGVVMGVVNLMGGSLIPWPVEVMGVVLIGAPTENHHLTGGLRHSFGQLQYYKGRNGLAVLNPSGVMSGVLCQTQCVHNNTMFEYNGAHQCRWYYWSINAVGFFWKS